MNGYTIFHGKQDVVPILPELTSLLDTPIGSSNTDSVCVVGNTESRALWVVGFMIRFSLTKAFLIPFEGQEHLFSCPAQVSLMDAYGWTYREQVIRPI